MSQLTNYTAEAFAIACEHGFHDTDLPDEHFKCLIVSELMEAVEADRKGNRANLESFDKLTQQGADFKKTFEHYIKDSVADELADACIRIFDFAGLRNIALESSMKINRRQSPTFASRVYGIVQNFFDFRNAAISLNVTLNAIYNLAAELDIDLYRTSS